MSKRPPAFDITQLPELAVAETPVAGVDEVGRGSLFGPVVAAAVIVSPDVVATWIKLGIRDSKQLSPKVRAELGSQIVATALDSQIGLASVEEIDRLNIFHASLLAMKRAVLKLNPPPELCLVDGKFTIPGLGIKQKAIVGGDRTSLVIAAASIVAKVWRDRLILEWADTYPKYHLATNKGYGTEQHRRAIAQHGPTPLHRRSFRPCQISSPNP